MSKSAGQASVDTLSRVVEQLVEHKIRLDAWEDVLKETNPLIHEYYLGTIEYLRSQKAGEVNRVLAQTLNSQPAKS
jgi:hypothetical protein